MTDKVTDANIWKSICRQHIQKKCSPSLPTSLFAFSTSSKFDHVFASCTLSTIRRLTNLSTHTEKEFNMHKNYRGWTSTSDTVQIVSNLPHRHHSAVFSWRFLYHSALSDQRRMHQRSGRPAL